MPLGRTACDGFRSIHLTTFESYLGDFTFEDKPPLADGETVAGHNPSTAEAMAPRRCRNDRSP